MRIHAGAIPLVSVPHQMGASLLVECVNDRIQASEDPRQLSFDWAPPRRPYKQRFRQFDLPVLRTVGTAGLIPSWTLIARLWNYEGYHPGHAWRVLSQLTKAGLVYQHKLLPGDGQRSPRILELTTAGYAESGVTPPRTPYWERPEAFRWHLAARAETLSAVV